MSPPPPTATSSVSSSVLCCSNSSPSVPWPSAFKTAELVSGPVRFTLAASGHIAGVINPASRNKRNFWIDGEMGKGSDRWLETARQMPGSWWPDWSAWLRTHAGRQVVAHKGLGNQAFAEIEPAPGRYVMARSETIGPAA